MSNILLVLAKDFRKSRSLVDEDTKWCYIGKDVDLRDRISSLLGEDKRFFLKDRLHKIAGEIRQPYLDLIAELGKHQRDLLEWWAGRFASKSPFQTDFFLLLCYKVLIKELINEFLKKQENICIFIEDPWIFYDFKREYKNNNIIFIGSKWSIYKKKLFFVGKGIIYRILLAGHLIISKAAITYYYRHKIQFDDKKRSIGIISFAEKRALTSNGYKDPYTGDLEGFLKDKGFYVIRPVFINIPFRLIRGVCSSHSNLWPLINDFKIRDLKCILKYWRTEFQQDVNIMGFALNTLLKREQLEEFSKVAFNRYLILFNTMKRFIERKWCSTLIYFFENQPWEKIVCMAAREAGNIKLIGYQHSTVPKFLLMYFLGKGEAEFMPLPDKIITNGQLPHRLLKEDGYPEDKIVLGGAWRYKHLLDNKHSVNKRISKPIKILVALPIDISMAKLILKLIIYSFSECGKNLDTEFWIKPHPDIPLNKLSISQNQLRYFRIIDKPLAKIIHDVVIASGTPGIEAVLSGKALIRLIPENLIDLDPLRGLNLPGVIECYEDNFKEKLVEAINQMRQRSEINSHVENIFFSDIKAEVWLKEVRVS